MLTRVISVTVCYYRTRTSYTVTSNTSPILGTYQTSGIVTDGLVLNLDAGNTNSYPSPFNSTSWTDLSGNNNHGTLNGGVGYTSANGGVLVFDGADDYVSVLTGILPKANSIKTISFWCQGINSSRYFATISTRFLNSYGYLIVIDYNSGGRIQYSHTGMGDYVVRPSLAILNYYYVTISTDVNGTGIIIYLNGIMQTPTSNTIVTAVNEQDGGYTTIGQQGGSFSNGYISNVTFYNRALSSAEITQNFNALRGRYGI